MRNQKRQCKTVCADGVVCRAQSVVHKQSHRTHKHRRRGEACPHKQEVWGEIGACAGVTKPGRTIRPDGAGGWGSPRAPWEGERGSKLPGRGCSSSDGSSESWRNGAERRPWGEEGLSKSGRSRDAWGA